jgi:hypothetical protein
MSIGNIVLRLLLAIWSLLIFHWGNTAGRPKFVKEAGVDATLTPGRIWLGYYVVAAIVGLVFQDNYLLICGVWLLGGYLLGLLTELLMWKIAPPKNPDEWLKKAKEKKEAKPSAKPQPPVKNFTDALCVNGGPHQLDAACKCTQCGVVLHDPEEVTERTQDWEDGIDQFIRCKRCAKHIRGAELPQSWLAQCKIQGHKLGSGCVCDHCGETFHQFRRRLTQSGSLVEEIEQCDHCGQRRSLPATK